RDARADGISLREAAERRNAEAAFASDPRIFEKIQRKPRAVPRALQKIPARCRARDGRLHLDRADPCGQAAQDSDVRSRVECNSWKSQSSQREDGRCGAARLRRLREILSASALRSDRHANSKNARAACSARTGARGVWSRKQS